LVPVQAFPGQTRRQRARRRGERSGAWLDDDDRDSDYQETRLTAFIASAASGRSRFYFGKKESAGVSLNKICSL
jgi:hypothetical protein